ncbi:MAG: hypothetical protein M1530_02535 [Candidatus Marsarchaeota archaeon]|nr:hypothetical protein [Candidatus Marsarchaeota archaeon]
MAMPASSEWKTYLYLLLFVLIGLAADRMPLNAIVGGAGASLTFFDIFVHLPIMLLGLANGLLAIIIAKLLSIVVMGKPVDMLALLRLLPPMAAGAFFWTYGKNDKMARLLQLGVPALMILLFVFHPGMTYSELESYALWWVIPIAAALARPELADKIVRVVLGLLALGLTGVAAGWIALPAGMPAALVGPAALLAWAVALAPIRFSARAYGTTFSQHALGSVLFLYTVPALQNPGVWLALIPVVALERTLLGGGLFFTAAGMEAVLARMALLRRQLVGGAQPAQGTQMPQRRKKGTA